MLLWGGWWQSPCRAVVLSIPWCVGPTVLPGKALGPFHKRTLALQAGKYEIRNDGLKQTVCQERYLLFCFALTRFDLYRTKSFSSPGMKASLWIPVNANVPHRPLCQKWLCHDTWIFYFCRETGHKKMVECSSFTCRVLVQLSQNSGSEIQVLDQACLVSWSPGDWCVFGWGKVWGTAVLRVWELRICGITVRWCYAKPGEKERSQLFLRHLC